MQRNVYLHGQLANFGKEWSIEAPVMADVIKLIDCQAEGFRKFLIEAAEAGLELSMVVDNETIEYPEEMLLENRKGNVHLALMPSGSKRGWGRLILGAIIIAASFWFGVPGADFSAKWAAMKAGADISTFALLGMSIGINIAMMGLTELMAKAPSHEKDPEAGLFNGPDSTVIQGTPVPLAYGQLLLGGKPISVNFKASGGYTGTGSGGGSTYTGLWDDIYAANRDWLNDIDAKNDRDYIENE
tara:strand:+ start:383 stop:1111 length:729 start_codon:yes stop_codon:yes gene_type:complete